MARSISGLEFPTRHDQFTGSGTARQLCIDQLRNVLLDENNSNGFLREKGMRIGFGDRKRYAAEKANLFCNKKD